MGLATLSGAVHLALFFNREAVELSSGRSPRSGTSRCNHSDAGSTTVIVHPPQRVSMCLSTAIWIICPPRTGRRNVATGGASPRFAGEAQPVVHGVFPLLPRRGRGAGACDERGTHSAMRPRHAIIATALLFNREAVELSSGRSPRSGTSRCNRDAGSTTLDRAPFASPTPLLSTPHPLTNSPIHRFLLIPFLQLSKILFKNRPKYD